VRQYYKKSSPLKSTALFTIRLHWVHREVYAKSSRWGLTFNLQYWADGRNHTIRIPSDKLADFLRGMISLITSLTLHKSLVAPDSKPLNATK